MFIYTIGDIIGVIMVLVMFVIVIIAAIEKHLRQYLCKHERYYETIACDAVCRNCGKNLGFIGTVRDERRKIKEDSVCSNHVEK